jgi:succinyl-diaminopimelate desuccinylase
VIAAHSKTLELACDLISRASVTPEDGGCQQQLAKILAAAGFTCESHRFENVDNLWARCGTASPLFVFAGHTDVVPTGPLADWTTPPFQAIIKDGKLYGRGASDMKAAIAAMVVAATTFVREHQNFRGSIAFLLTSDEEGPSLYGTKKVMEVLKQRGEQIDYCVIGEPSSDQTAGDQIRIGRRGSLHGKLAIHGKQGHVAHPHLAINPIHTSALALHELTCEQWDAGNADFPATSFQITNVHAGTGASNVIPGHIEIDFNFRFSTAITVEQLKARVEAKLQQHKLSFDIKWTVGAEPFLTKKGKLLPATQQAIQEMAGLNTRLSTGGGTSDGRFIAPTGAELLELGTSHATAHQIDEHVLAADVEKLTAIYQRILELTMLP